MIIHYVIHISMDNCLGDHLFSCDQIDLILLIYKEQLNSPEQPLFEHEWQND